MELIIWRALAGLSLAIWVYLFALRGGFWQLRERLPSVVKAGKHSVVAVVIPARDEVHVVAETVTTLRQQTGSFALHIIVADDESSDGTGEAGRRAGADSVVSVSRRPDGWKGKLWALQEGLACVPDDAEYILFTDADIAYGKPDVIDRLLSSAREGFDLVTVMAHLRCESAAERLLIPAFVYFFFKLYPPRWVATKCSVAAAAGGCMLIRRETFERLGGIASYRGALIDDCALARRVKAVGGRVWLGMSDGDVYSTRGYDSAGVIRAMIARSAFDQLQHSALLLAGTLLGMVVIYLVPLSFLATRDPLVALASLFAYILSVIMFVPSVATFRAPRWTAFCMPAIAAFYLVATVESALNYWRGKGGTWKGRVQDNR